MANSNSNLPEASITPNKDYNPARHDDRVIHLRSRPLFDWDILQGREIIKEQIGFVIEELLTDGAFGDGWQALQKGNALEIRTGKIKIGNHILELYFEEDRTINLVPTVEYEDFIANGFNDDRKTGTNVTFQLAHPNLRSLSGSKTAATPPNGSLEEFRDHLVDFYVQGTNSDIVQIDALNGFITFNSPPLLAELTEGVFVSYNYGKTGTANIPTLVYSEVELVRITENEDPYLVDDILEVSGAWRDQFQIRLIADTNYESWDQLLADKMSHEGYGSTYFIFKICTVVDGRIISDDRSKVIVSPVVAPFSDHGQLKGLYNDDHPQYLTKERHSGLDHGEFLEGVSKLSGVTVFGITGYSDRTLNVDATKPWLVSASSLDTYHVDLAFSEKIDPITGLNIANYAIRKVVDSSPLVVRSATMLSNSASIRLTTDRQSADQFGVTVTGVKDTFGNPIDTAEGHNQKQFVGKV